MSRSNTNLLQELERIFNELNNSLFSGRLKVPAFVIHIDKKSVFRFVPESYHLVIGSNFAQASLEDIVCDLLHEMVHILNWLEGVTDCTSNQYHNKHFLEQALGIGLFVVRHKTQGWGVTKLSIQKAQKARVPHPEAMQFRLKVLDDLHIKKKLILDGKEDIGQAIRARGVRKVCFLKYECSCPPPHNSIRSGRRPDGAHPLKAVCKICGQEFVCVKGQ